MSALTRTFVDKSDWGPGEWMDEPDKVQWTDEATGLTCLARRNEMFGNWCGYVGVDQTHPLYGKDYDKANNFVSVHGGLTYAAVCDGDEEFGICHVPDPGGPEPLWWFGFDCGHFQDRVPAMEARDRALGRESLFPREALYQPLGYVLEECRQLASQLKVVKTR